MKKHEAAAPTSCSACDGREHAGGMTEHSLWKLLLASASRSNGSDPVGATEAWNEAMLDACIMLDVRAIFQAGSWRILGNPRPFFSSQRAVDDLEWPTVTDHPAILWQSVNEDHRTALIEALSGVAGISSIERIDNGWGGNDTYCNYEGGHGLAVFVQPGFPLRDLFITIDDKAYEVSGILFHNG